MNLLSRLFQLPVIGQTPANVLALPPFLQFDGNIPDLGSFIGSLNGINQFNVVGSGLNFQSSAGATITLTSLQNLYQKLTNGGAVTVTLDAAYNIVNQMQFPFVGQTFPIQIFSSGAGTVATPTLTGTGVTLSGTTSITAGNRRTYQGTVTQLVTVTGAAMTPGTTFTSLTQVGTTNRFTVVVATNAIVPVVGTAVFINVTTGTLPSGWYPIDQVTSATSFVIVTPPGTVWTATAATLPGTTVVPTSQYQNGYTLGTAGVQAGIYSPLLTITAVDSVAAIV